MLFFMTFVDSNQEYWHDTFVMALFSFRHKRQPKEAPPIEPRKEKSGMESLKAGKLAKFALDRTAGLISEFGPRVAGSEAARNCAQRLKEDLAYFCDTTESQEFPMRPGAFTGWLKIAVVVYPVVLLLLWVGMPICATTLCGVFIFLVFSEFICYKPWGEQYYPEEHGCNIHGVMEPAEDVRQTVIFSGHHDSARLYRYNKLDKKDYFLKVGVPFGLLSLVCVVAPLQLFTELFTGRFFRLGLPPVLFIVLLSLLTIGFPLILPLWRFMGDDVSPGAGDNLISSCMSVELARFYASRRHRSEPLKHTRLIFASFDAEEVGLRGSRQWFSQNSDLYRDTIGNGWHFNFDCPYYVDDLTFLVRDVNGTVKLSQQMATGCVEIAKSMGYKAKSQSLPLFAGGTDAAEGARAGLHAVTLTAMPWDDVSKPAVYHTPQDLPEAIQPDVIEEAISIAIKFVDLLDADKLPVDSPWKVAAELPAAIATEHPAIPGDTGTSDNPNDPTGTHEPPLPELKFKRLSKR